MSIRAKANNIAKQIGIAPQAVLQAYFAERFLARLAQSEYAGCAVIKGGTLMSSLFGIAERTTMDIDTTFIGLPGDETSIRTVIERVCGVDAADGIVFRAGRAVAPRPPRPEVRSLKSEVLPIFHFQLSIFNSSRALALAARPGRPCHTRRARRAFQLFNFSTFQPFGLFTNDNWQNCSQMTIATSFVPPQDFDVRSLWEVPPVRPICDL